MGPKEAKGAMRLVLWRPRRVRETSRKMAQSSNLDDAELGEPLPQPNRRPPSRRICSWGRSSRRAATEHHGWEPASLACRHLPSTPMRSRPPAAGTGRGCVRAAASNAKPGAHGSPGPTVPVVLLQREHAERHVASLVAHDVAKQLLQSGSVVIWCMVPKAASARPSIRICIPRYVMSQRESAMMSSSSIRRCV